MNRIERNDDLDAGGKVYPIDVARFEAFAVHLERWWEEAETLVDHAIKVIKILNHVVEISVRTIVENVLDVLAKLLLDLRVNGQIVRCNSQGVAWSFVPRQQKNNALRYDFVVS